MDLLRQGTFWLIWLLFFIGAGAGLMVVGSVAGMAKGSLGAYAFLAAVVLAVGNAGGRVVAGILCDKIGPKPTMITIYALQAALMFLSIGAVGEDASPLILVLVATFIGFNYGANLSMFPAFTKDIGGVQQFGVNYGLVFTAWGIGGFVMSRISQTLVSESGSFSTSFMMAGVLLAVGVLLGFLVKDKTAQQRRARRKPA
jgi:MFS family permease